MIDITDIAKPEVLAALYNAAGPRGMGALAFRSGGMCPSEAAGLFESHTYFDYVRGRPLKVDLSGDFLDPYLYDRDHGPGAAARALAPLIARRDAEGGAP